MADGLSEPLLGSETGAAGDSSPSLLDPTPTHPDHPRAHTYVSTHRSADAVDTHLDPRHISVGPRRRTLSGSAPFRRRTANTPTLPDREDSGDDLGDGVLPSVRGEATLGLGTAGRGWRAAATKAVDSERRSLEQRLAVAKWCYDALEGGYAPIPIAWWFPSTNRFFSRPVTLSILYFLAVLLPLIAFFLYAFQPKNKFECGPDACAPLTYINSTIPPQCTIDPPSYFPVLSVCSYVGPEQNVSHGALSFPQCQPSPVGAKMAFSSNETVRSTQTDFVIPAIACAYECTEQTCPGWYHINDRSAWAVWLIMGAISALVTVIKVLTLRSSMEPYKVWELIRKLTAGLPMGTFMVSYSWGARPGEECSSTVVEELARLLPACWWDKEQLLPGASVTEMCTTAASNCTYAFVFISFSYMRSPICQTEIRVLREKRGRIFAAVHSDVAQSAEGQTLMAELESEGHKVWLVRPGDTSDVGLLTTAFHLCINSLVRPLVRLCGGSSDDAKAEEYVFRVGGRWVGTVEFVWLVLCAHDALLNVCRIRSPPMNAAGWKVTAAVLRGDQSHWRHVSFVLMSLAFPIFALILAFEWESSSDRQLVKYYTIVLALIWGWVMLIIGSRQMRARRISHHEVTDPHAPPPNVLPGSVPRYAREHSMPPSGALLTILHRAGVLSSNQLVPYAECDPVWPLPRGLLPAAIHVDIGKGMPVRRLHPLVAAGVIRVVPEGCVTAEFRLIKLEPLAPHKDGDNVCPELYWSECGFAELHPETQDMMSNRIVMVNTTGGPCIETIIIQLLIWKFKSDSSTVFSGSGKTKWRSKSLRAAYRRR